MIQQEDSTAKELFKTYKLSLVNYCIRKHKLSAEASEEVVSETFCRLSENAHKVAGRAPAAQRSWLFSALENVISEHNRKDKHMVKDSIETFEPYLESNDEYGQIIEDLTYDELINEIKSRLNSEEKLYFENFIYGDHNYRELSENLGVNYHTYRGKMHRIVSSIRKISLEVLKEHEISIDGFIGSGSKKNKKKSEKEGANYD